MKLIKTTFVASALALLRGCIAVPVNSGYYEPAPVVYAPPVYFGPSIGIGVGVYGGYRGQRGYGRGYGYR